MISIKSITTILVSALIIAGVAARAGVDEAAGAPAQSTIAADPDVNLLVAMTSPSRTVVDLGGPARHTTDSSSAEIAAPAGSHGAYLEGLKNIITGLVNGVFGFGYDSETSTGSGREGT